MKLKIVILSCILSIQMIYGATNKHEIPTFISSSWLKQHYNDKRLVIIDVRKEELYNKGHLEHAVNLPTFKKLFDSKLFMPKINILKQTFSDAGINSNSLVAIYDNGDFIWAARCYWLLDVLGHTNVGLLRDSFLSLKNQNFKITTKPFIPKPKEFIPMVDNSIIETKLSTMLAINKKVIIDGRPKEYYDGYKSVAKRSGHIKSALNYPGSGNSRKTVSGNHILKIGQLKKTI